MGPPPERPGDDMGRLDLTLCHAIGDAADFLDGPADQHGRRDLRFVFGGGAAFA